MLCHNDSYLTTVQSQTGTCVLGKDVQSNTGTGVHENDVQSNTSTGMHENDVQSNISSRVHENGVQSENSTSVLGNDVQSDNSSAILGNNFQYNSSTGALENDDQPDSSTLPDPCGPVMTFDLLGPVGERLLCPTCVSVSLSGEFVVSDTDSCFVVIYSSTGQYLSHFSTIPKRMFYMFLDLAKYRPQDVAWLSSKRIVYTQPAGCRVIIADWKGKSTVTIEGRPLYEPYGVCVDQSDKIYITDRAKGRILCYNCDGKLIKSLGVFGSREVLCRPHYICVANNGNICVNELSKDESRVHVYSKSGTSSCVVAKGDNHSLGNIAVDSEGFVLQVDLQCDHLVMCCPPKLNGYTYKTATGEEEHKGKNSHLLVSRTLTSDLGGITLTNNDHLVCIDRKEKQVKNYIWNNHKENLIAL
ncbi:uncharacterized protein LOC132548059 [Ylistrum balloti]|uniref:uncharacterized protein LOC132548059 n=1 Tax=Ylistrum balloti TaxID=509963 RepID=UPI002905C1BF|nr:uncharacterized protein LOC132548059 [Ylistrum balloti]